MAGRILEITLKSLTVQKNGEVTRQDGRNLLTVSLIYPCPGKPTVTTVKSLALREGVTQNFETASYADQILFKEEVIGPTLLVVQLTDVESPSRVTKFLTGLFSSVFSAALTTLAPGGSNLILAAAVHSAASLEIDSLRMSDDDRLYVIGSASLEILPDTPLPMDAIRILTVPGDVNREKSVFKEGTNQVIRKEQFILKAGQQNGSITFGIREL
jgi:hypothetical protein